MSKRQMSNYDRMIRTFTIINKIRIMSMMPRYNNGDWKTVIYIYVCGKCRTQFMLPMEKSVTFTGACANEIIPSINRSFVYKAKEGCGLESG
jgi:hypothetical protein